MIFDGAFTRNDINDLLEYYGQTPVIGDTSDKEEDKYVAPETPENLADDIAALVPEKDLDLFFDFDGNTTNSGNPAYTATENGTMIYRDGYRGQSYRPGLGYVQVPNYTFGTDSFSIGFWLNCSAINGTNSAILATQNMSNGAGQGFSFILSGEYKQFIFRMGNEEVRAIKQFKLPENFYDGWNHITLVVDRVNCTARVYFNFVELPELYGNNSLFNYDNSKLMFPSDATADGLAGSHFTIGQDGQGDWSLGLKNNLDELMVWKGALTAVEIARLQEHYFPKPTLEEVTGLSPDLYLDFNGTMNDKVSGNAPTAGNVTNYVEGPFGGTAADFRGAIGVFDNKPCENYVNFSDFDICDGSAETGYNSVTFVTWLRLADVATSKGDRVLFGTGDGNAREKNPGLAVMIYNPASKIQLADLPAWANPDDYTTDADGYVMQNGEYVYRQLIIIRATSDVLQSNGTYYNDNVSAFIYVTPSQWIHFAFVADRGQFGKDDGEYRVYQDGKQAPCSNVYGMAMGNMVEDKGSLNGAGFMINDDIGHTQASIPAMLDDVLVFKKALTAAELGRLYEYYVPKTPLKEYIDKAPDYYFDFDGIITNEGDEDLEFTVTDPISYVSGTNGSAIDLSTKGYVQLDEDYKLGTDSFTVGFWVNTALTAGDPPILSNADWASSSNDGFSILINKGNILMNMCTGGKRVRGEATGLVENYSGQWVYVLCVIDRENSQYKVSFNFGEFQVINMKVYENNSTDVSGFDADGTGPLTIGQDAQGDFHNNANAHLDEFMIWREALDADDLVGLKAYFEQ